MSATFKKSYIEIKTTVGDIIHVYSDDVDAGMHEHDYRYAGWALTGWNPLSNKLQHHLKNAWLLKSNRLLPKVGSGGWAR